MSKTYGNGLRLVMTVLFTGGLLLGTLAGCAKKKTADKTEAKTDAPKTTPENGDPAKLADAQKANLAKLSEQDRQYAMEQKYCPVGGGMLGTAEMGVPFKVEGVQWNGKPVFVCCDGCAKPLKEDPKKYLAKLDEKHKAKK